MAGHFLFLLVFLGTFARTMAANFQPANLRGETFIHDPSTIAADAGKFFTFGTKPGIGSLVSTNLIDWSEASPVFASPPEWTINAVTGFDGNFWAPEIVRCGKKYFLFYSISAWGRQTSFIGVAENTTLDNSATNFLWRDLGPVIGSTNGSAYNTIDPSALVDEDGKLWLAFGSYWQGIYLIELNPQTAKTISSDPPPVQLAWNPSIEAACLTKHKNFYYLFVNWGQCCQGTNSTYEIRVGRAKKITGPYLDREGKNLAAGGGSVFLQSQGRYIGPGHVGILNRDGDSWFSYHYYDAEDKGRSRLALGKIDWGSGWPKPVSPQIKNAKDWRLIWSDEFNNDGPPNSEYWNYEHGFARNNELQWYQPENAFCTNGLLVIEARQERKPNPWFDATSSDWREQRKFIEVTSASLTTRRRQEFTYGKFEMRARIDTQTGSWPAFWTVGTQAGIHWPACGEIDIMEFYTGKLLANFGWREDGKILWRSKKFPIEDFGDPGWSRQFHVWTMEWDRDEIKLMVDGRLLHRLNLADANKADSGNPFHRPVCLILNQAIGGNSGGDTLRLKYPVRLEVDWVRVYQKQ